MSSAHGKVILLGEHSVVYGRPALAAAISPGVDAVAKDSGEETLSLYVRPWECGFAEGDGSDLGKALTALSQSLGVTGLRIDAVMHLPGGGGLGSSASLGVACARAAAEARGIALDDARLLDVALAWERVFHGNPSGVDHTLAALGGVGVFTKSEGLKRVQPRSPLRLCIGDTGERASTKEMVAVVARAYEKRPEATTKTFERHRVARAQRGARARGGRRARPRGAHGSESGAPLVADGVDGARRDAVPYGARSGRARGEAHGRGRRRVRDRARRRP